MPTPRAMILAAGHGTRLGPLGQDRPKPMLPVGGRPLVEHAFSLLKKAGIEDVILNSFTLADALESHVGDGARFGVRASWSRETGQILGTGGGVRHARWFFGERTCVVMNGKIVTTAELSAALAFHRERRAGVTLVLRPDPEAGRWGGFTLDPDGRVRSMLGVRTDGSASQVPATHMFTGISLLEPEFLDLLPEGPHCLVREGFRPWFLRGGAFFGHVLPDDAYWWDHSTPSRYLQGNLNLFSPAVRACLAGELAYHPTRSGVIAAPGADLPDSVSVSGGLVLGEGSSVAPGMHLENVVVWKNCRIDAPVANAVVTPAGVVPVDLADPGARTGPALTKN
ncbi:nucleotidyltransferase family protein [Myxococcota bacterium]|nr:nucleotidyltransferase family protein [Myxococcota bacterium]